MIATSGRPGPVLVDLPKDVCIFILFVLIIFALFIKLLQVTAATLKELPDCVPQVPAKFLLPTDHV